MKNIFYIVCIAVFLVLSVPSPTNASIIARSGDEIRLDEDQIVRGDFYVAGGDVKLDGNIEGDVFVAGGIVEINGEVSDDVVAIGGEIILNGPVNDDIRVLGGNVRIQGTVAGDTIVFGGTVTTGLESVLEGDVLFYGGDVSLDGVVEGAVNGRGEYVVINGTINGDVSVGSVESPSLGNSAYIGGNFAYESRQELVRAPNSVILGETEYTRSSFGISEAGSISLVPFLIMMFTSLVYLLLFKTRVQWFVEYAVKSYGKYGLMGLLTMFVVPIVSMLLIVTVLGIPLGIVLLFLYFFLIVFSWSLGGILLGAVLWKVFRKKLTVNTLSVVVGSAAFVLLAQIPILGVILMSAVVLIVLGGLMGLLISASR